MTNFWTEVDDCLNKGKDSKLIKVRAKDLADLRTKLTDLENEISLAQNRIQTLTEIKLDMTKQIEKLQHSQSSLDETVENQIRSQSEMIEELEKELSEHQKQYSDLQTKSIKKDRLIKEFKQKLDEAITKIKEQVAIIDNYEKLDKKHLLIQKELEAQLEAERKRANLSDEQKKAQQAIELEVQNLKRTCKRYEVDIKEKDAEIENLHEKLLLVEKTAPNPEIEMKLIEIEKQLQEKTLQLSQEQQDSSSMRQSMQQELELAQEKLSELTESKKLAMDELEKEILHLKNAHQQEIEHIRSQFGSSNDGETDTGGKSGQDPQLSDLIKKLRISNAKVQELQLKLRKTTKSEQKLKLNNQKMETEIAKFEGNYIPRTEFDSLKTELQEVKQKKDALAQNREILLNENESLRLQLEEVTSELPTSEIPMESSVSQPEKAPLREDTNVTSKISAPVVVPTSSQGRKAESRQSTTLHTIDPVVARLSDQTARIKCPNCGSIKLKEIDDKTKVISYIPQVVYSKKTLCTQCGYSFSHS